MKRVQSIFVLVILLMISGCTAETDVVATVNDKKIPKQQLEKQLVLAEISYSINGYDFPSSGQDQRDAEDQLVKKLVESYVLVDIAQKEGIQIQEEDAVAQRDSLVETIVSLYGSDEKYHEFLKEKGQNKDDFHQYLLDIAKDNEYISRLYEKITEDVSTTSEERKAYYEENNKYYNYSSKSVMAIEVKDKKAAQKLHDEITKDNLDFEEAMIKFKDDQSVVKVGDLGPLYYGSMEEEYSQVVFSTNVGEISPVFESGGNYHIVKIYHENEEEALPYEEIKEIVEDDLLKERKNQAYRKYVEQEMKNYDIGLN